MASYLLITPARDEEPFIEATIRAVAAQTHPPALWIVVDDGSRDRTAEIVEEWAGRLQYLQLRRTGRTGPRAVGSPVVEAFYAGVGGLDLGRFDFIAKLDADILLPPRYFETLTERFAQNDRLGIAGGACAGPDGHIERVPGWHVRGALKCYRREVFLALGRLESALGWDTADEIRAMMAGWETRSFEDLLVRQQRPTGSGSGVLRGRLKQGLACWNLGYDLALVLMKAGLLVFSRSAPGLGGLAFLGGYISGLWRGRRILSEAEQRFLRRLKWGRILRLASRS